MADKPIWRRTGAVIFAIIGLLVASPPAVAVDGWSTPRRATWLDRVSSMVDEPSGHIHATGTKTGDGRGVYYVTNATGTFVAARASKGRDRNPAIALDAQGKVYIVSARHSGPSSGDTSRGLYLATKPRTGSTFAVERIGSGPSNDDGAAITIHGGRVHVAFSRTGSGIHLASRPLGGGAWTIGLVSADTHVDNRLSLTSTSLAFTQAHVPWVAWMHVTKDPYVSRGIRLAHRTGTTWTRQSLTFLDAWSPRIAIDDDDRVHLCYADADWRVYYRTNRGQASTTTFSTQRTIADDAIVCAITTLANGCAAVVTPAVRSGAVTYRVGRATGPWTAVRVGTGAWPEVAADDAGKASILFSATASGRGGRVTNAGTFFTHQE